MNSTPDPKATEPGDAQVAAGAGTDERLAHAHEQIIRADEELARLSERLAKIEGDAARPSFGRRSFGQPAGFRRSSFGRTWSVTSADQIGAPGPRRLAAGRVHRCRGPRLVVLWRRSKAVWCPLGAAARINDIIAAGKSNACRAVRAIHRSSGRGGDSNTAVSNSAGSTSTGSTSTGNAIGSNAAAGNIPGPGSARTARGRSGSGHRASRSDTVAANHGARSREP